MGFQDFHFGTQNENKESNKKEKKLSLLEEKNPRITGNILMPGNARVMYLCTIKEYIKFMDQGKKQNLHRL